MDFNFPRRSAQPFAFYAVAVCVAVLLLSALVRPQSDCASPDRVAALQQQIKDVSNLKPSAELKNEILAMKNDLVKQTAQNLAAQNAETTSKKNADTQANSSQTAPVAPANRICQILNSSPWPSKSVVDAEAASAWMKLVKTYLSVQQQRDLLPIVAAGVANGEIPKDDETAAFIDRLRLRLNIPQLFGTQLTEQNGFLVLYPLQSETNVDAWRKEYGLRPLREYLLVMQNFYRRVVIRSTAKVRRVPVADSAAATTNGAAPIDVTGGDEVVKVETSLVNIDATVSGKTVPQLTKDDFRVFEDGVQQEISTFGASDEPFDIVLLLDLSGSTSDKLNIIKKTTRHFIETKRDVDRVAIVTFNSTQTVVSPLEPDKQKLFDKISSIKGIGASKVWDSEKFAMDLLERDSPGGRRKAVVVMTDGIDNDLFYTPGPGSEILFADLVEAVRNSQIAIFPIYLNPQGPERAVAGMADDARRTMQLLADESGGTLYTTANLDSLNEVYERVLEDVGRVYSLGYQSKNDKRDGTWRSIRVEIPTHPELKVRSRSGYYAR
jgi:VWFA-related protein